MIETSSGGLTPKLCTSLAVIDTTTTQMTSPSAEGPRSRRIACRRVAGSLSKCRSAQARFEEAPPAPIMTCWRRGDVVPYLRRLDELFMVAAAAAAPRRASRSPWRSRSAVERSRSARRGRFRHGRWHCERARRRAAGRCRRGGTLFFEKNCGHRRARSRPRLAAP